MKTFKLILLLSLVFFAGAVIGVVGTRAVVRHVVQRGRFCILKKSRRSWKRKLTRNLRLDNGQQVKLHQILTDAHAQLQDLRQQYRPQLGGIFSNANGQINAHAHAGTAGAV